MTHRVLGEALCRCETGQDVWRSLLESYHQLDEDELVGVVTMLHAVLAYKFGETPWDLAGMMRDFMPDDDEWVDEYMPKIKEHLL